MLWEESSTQGSGKDSLVTLKDSLLFIGGRERQSLCIQASLNSRSSCLGLKSCSAGPWGIPVSSLVPRTWSAGSVDTQAPEEGQPHYPPFLSQIGGSECSLMVKLPGLPSSQSGLFAPPSRHGDQYWKNYVPQCRGLDNSKREKTWRLVSFQTSPISFFKEILWAVCGHGEQFQTCPTHPNKLFQQ